MKAFIISPMFGEGNLLKKYGFEITTKMSDAAFVVFTGGADINPAIYGAKRHETTYFSQTRDAYEIEMYNQAKRLNKAMLGICRGAQLLWALNGGILGQDVEGHVGSHEVIFKDQRRIVTTSCHHQYCIPDEYMDIHAVSFYSEKGIDENFDKVKVYTPEIFTIKGEKIVCTQGHPEFSQEDKSYDEYREYVINLVKEKICAVS